MENIKIKSWKEIQELRSAASRAARREAQAIRWTGDDGRQYRYKHIQPNGFAFYGYDALGDCVYEPARCHDAPTTKADFIAEVERLFEIHEEIVEIGIECHYDGASSMHAYWKEGDYDPQVAYGDTGIIAYRDLHTLITELKWWATDADSIEDIEEALEETIRLERSPKEGLHLKRINQTGLEVVWNIRRNEMDSSQIRSRLADIRATFKQTLEAKRVEKPTFAQAFDHFIANIANA